MEKFYGLTGNGFFSLVGSNNLSNALFKILNKYDSISYNLLPYLHTLML